MPRRISLQLDREALSVLALLPPEVHDPGFSLSDRANLVLVRYANLVRQSCPAMTEGEWCAVCEVARELPIHSTPSDSALQLWARVAARRELGSKWRLDQPALVARLHALSPPAAYAVADVAARFWARAPLGEPPRDALLASGARLAGAH